MDGIVLQIGRHYDVASGMGGSFRVRLLALTDDPEPCAHLRVDMPRNRDWHGYVLTCRPDQLREVRP